MKFTFQVRLKYNLHAARSKIHQVALILPGLVVNPQKLETGERRRRRNQKHLLEPSCAEITILQVCSWRFCNVFILSENHEVDLNGTHSWRRKYALLRLLTLQKSLLQ